MFDEDGVYDYGMWFDEQQIQNVKDGGLCKECCYNDLHKPCKDTQCPVYKYRKE